MDDLKTEFPDLFSEMFWEWGPMHAQFALHTVPPQPISNVNLIPHTRDGWVIIRLAHGEWSMPGGTLEPNETFVEALHREMLEEAGARVLSFQPLGAWHCRSLAEKPYRPHMPHPEFYRFVCVGEVEITAPPLNPPDGEQVLSVDVVSIDEIVRRAIAQNTPALGQLYQLAAKLAAR